MTVNSKGLHSPRIKSFGKICAELSRLLPEEIRPTETVNKTVPWVLDRIKGRRYAEL